VNCTKLQKQAKGYSNVLNIKLIHYLVKSAFPVMF